MTVPPRPGRSGKKLPLCPHVATFAVAVLLALSACAEDPATSIAPADTASQADTAPDAAADAAASDALPPDTATSEPEGPFLSANACNPLAEEWDCMLPWPSDVFVGPDDALPGGRRVQVPEAALPKDVDGKPVDLLARTPTDGFSVLPQIAVRVPGGLDEEPLVFHTDDRARTLGPKSPTLLLDGETGEPVLHFAELDPRVTGDKGSLLLIRPLARLRAGHRYVVGLHGLVHPDGSAVKPPEGFRRLRDDETAIDLVLGPLQRHFDERVFPVLADAGVERAALQLAWDFTTETDQSVTGDMLAIRESAMAVMTATPPVVTVLDVQDDVDAHTGRRITGTLRVPLYLDSAEPGGVLSRGEDGRPTTTGETEVPFTLLVPRSVMNGDAPLPARLLQFGHGFFGGRVEADGGYVGEFANETGMVVIALDWWGMTKEDLGVLLEDMVVDTNNVMRFTDRVHQAMVNFMAVGYAADAIAALEPLQVGGQPLVAPAPVYFYGISQGHILGSVFVSLSPHVERAVFSVGGAGFGLMMSRAQPFGAFMVLIDSRVGNDALETARIVLMMQTSFDRIDPIAYLPHLLSDTYPGSPASRRVLQHIGIGDTSVPNLGSHVFARSLGLPQVGPAPRPLEAIEPKTAPIDGSAVVEFDFGVPIPDILAVPVKDKNEVHEGVRRLAAAKQQIDAFLRPGGLVESFCDGACDPE